MLPIKLVIDNFLSHDHSELDFSTFDVALILGCYNGDFSLSNGAGKSSLFSALTFCVFDKANTKKKDNVVKKDRKSCRVEFTFSVPPANQVYRITRKRDKVIGGSEVILEQFDGKAYKDISCDTNTATNEKIEQIIGFNYDVFINSVYFKQNDISMFADSTSSKRKDIIKSLLKIEQWDVYHKRAKEKAKIISTRIEDKISRQMPYEDLEKQIKQSKIDVSNLQDEIKEHNNKYIELTEQLALKRSQFTNKFGDRKDLLDKLKQTIKEQNEAKFKLKSHQDLVDYNSKTILQSKRAEENLKTELKSLTETIKMGQNIDLNRINSSMIVGRTKEKVLKEQIIALEKELIFGSNCSKCKKALTKSDIDMLKVSHKRELEAARKSYAELKQKLQTAEKKAQDLRQKSEKATNAEIEKSKVEAKLTKCLSIITTAQKENDRLNKEIRGINLSDFEAQIATLKDRTNKTEADKIELEITDLEKEAGRIKDRVDRMNIELGSLIKHNETIVKQEKEQSEIQEELDKLNSEYSIYDRLKEYFGKDGIQSVIIENVIEDLETYTNETLSLICNEPTTISVKTQKQNDNGNWVEVLDIEATMGGRTDDLDSFSGGEKFRVSLALRLALSKVLAKRNGGIVKVLLLDEVSSSLDQKGLESFVSIVKKLGNEMKVLLISHDETLKSMINDVIVVEKTNKGSRIVKNY